jgi:dTDP-4-dehydrorhamnose reductase
MNKEQLKELKDELRQHFGAFKRVQTASGFSRSQVLEVLKGIRRNDIIIEAALNVLVEVRREKRERQQRIDELSNMVLAKATA